MIRGVELECFSILGVWKRGQCHPTTLLETGWSLAFFCRKKEKKTMPVDRRKEGEKRGRGWKRNSLSSFTVYLLSERERERGNRRERKTISSISRNLRSGEFYTIHRYWFLFSPFVPEINDKDIIALFPVRPLTQNPTYIINSVLPRIPCYFIYQTDQTRLMHWTQLHTK